MTEDRRKYERFSADWPIALKMPGMENNCSATAVNLSEGGACVELVDDIVMSGDVTMLFRGPSQVDGIECSARIVWVGTGEVGVEGTTLLGLEYRDLTTAQWEAIQTLLSGSESGSESSDSESD